MHAFAPLFIAALALLILYGWLVKPRVRGRKRRAALQAMGFEDVPRNRLFTDARALGRTFPQDNRCSIRDPVARGQTALGETILLDVDGAMDTDATTVFTAIGYRVDSRLPDFRILPMPGRIEQALGNVAGKAAAALVDAARNNLPPVAATTTAGAAGAPVEPPRRRAINARSVDRFFEHERAADALLENMLRCGIAIADPEFSRHYRVTGSSEVEVLAVLTPAFLHALPSPEYSKLALHKTGEWLFIYAGGWTKRLSPEQYGEWLARTTGLALLLDLHATVPDSAATAATH